MLLLSATYASGQFGRGLSGLLGGLCWAAALSMIPQYAWPTGSQPLWLIWYSAGFFAAAFLAASYTAAQYHRGARGKGWEALRAWAEDAPLRRRLYAQRALRALGYRAAEE
jgi:hypothetical protein